MGKTARNIFWAISALIAIVAIMGNLSHLATASIFFILGWMQTEED